MNKNSIDNKNSSQFLRPHTQEYIHQLFITNAQKSLTSRRNSQFLPYLDE
jgi:hypothetical protein